MTFPEGYLKEIKIDRGDDWQPEEDGTFSVMFFGLEEIAKGMFSILFGADYANFVDEQFPDSFIDCYAFIDAQNETVKRVEFMFKDGADETANKVINLSIYEEEGKLIFKQLRDTSIQEEFDAYLEKIKNTNKANENVSINTPMGELKAETVMDIDYPCIKVSLNENGVKNAVSVVEYDSEEKCIKSYSFEADKDEPKQSVVFKTA